jgi:hypothetical protein
VADRDRVRVVGIGGSRRPRPRGVDIGASQQRFDPGMNFERCVWLDQVVIGSDLKCDHAVCYLDACTQNKHGHLDTTFT